MAYVPHLSAEEQALRNVWKVKEATIRWDPIFRLINPHLSDQEVEERWLEWEEKNQPFSEVEWHTLLERKSPSPHLIRFLLHRRALPLQEQEGRLVGHMIRRILGYNPEFEDLMNLYYDAGADINEQTSGKGQTILHLVVSEVIMFRDRTPINTAAKRSLLYFLEKGADPCLEDKKGQTALSMAKEAMEFYGPHPDLVWLLTTLRPYE